MSDYKELVDELLDEVWSDGDMLAGPSEMERRAAAAITSLATALDAVERERDEAKEAIFVLMGRDLGQASEEETTIGQRGAACLVDRFTATIQGGLVRLALMEQGGTDTPQLRSAVIMSEPDATVLAQILNGQAHVIRTSKALTTKDNENG